MCQCDGHHRWWKRGETAFDLTSPFVYLQLLKTFFNGSPPAPVSLYTHFFMRPTIFTQPTQHWCDFRWIHVDYMSDGFLSLSFSSWCVCWMLRAHKTPVLMTLSAHIHLIMPYPIACHVRLTQRSTRCAYSDASQSLPSARQPLWRYYVGAAPLLLIRPQRPSVYS